MYITRKTPHSYSLTPLLLVLSHRYCCQPMARTPMIKPTHPRGGDHRQNDGDSRCEGLEDEPLELAHSEPTERIIYQISVATCTISHRIENLQQMRNRPWARMTCGPSARSGVNSRNKKTNRTALSHVTAPCVTCHRAAMTECGIVAHRVWTESQSCHTSLWTHATKNSDESKHTTD